ncbi:hypothetical protein GIB67_004786 [Kingdonia uniflora]|uniref:rRNA adenine N(6)-methyltransferase n=1 Tax=Kingdonia uniflora TaxID=39325 RepID=A0A7J7LNA9_9MAGN|nr:hypothetical protein GIB67_004786 [Kingdonia uniflora]
MLHQAKSLSLHLKSFLETCQSLRLFSTKSKPTRRYPRKDGDDDHEERERNRKEKYGEAGTIHLNKSRGQHILTNPRVLDAIVRKAEIKPTDTVLEIGPGTGNLTLRLLEAAEKVIAVEIDNRMIKILNTRVFEHRFQDRITVSFKVLQVICKDALKAEFPKFDLIVANIPYGISSPLIAKLVFGDRPFRNATLLLQKEFARRLLANPGESEYNRLAVNVKLVADVEFIMDVSKRDFVPCPRVDSSVVKIRPKAQVPDVDMHEWWAFTRTCFSKKNKTIGATFKQKKKLVELGKRTQAMTESKDNVPSDSYDNDDGEEDDEDEEEGGVEGECSSSSLEVEATLFKEKVIGVLEAGGFGEKRPSKMSNEELLHLLSLFNQAGIHFHDHDKRKEKYNVPFDASLIT